MSDLERVFLFQFKSEIYQNYIQGKGSLSQFISYVSAHDENVAVQHNAKMKPVLNLDHKACFIDLEEVHTGDYIPSFDQLKKDLDRRLAIARSFGRDMTKKANDIIIKNFKKEKDFKKISYNGRFASSSLMGQIIDFYLENGYSVYDLVAFITEKQYSDMLFDKEFMFSPESNTFSGARTYKGIEFVPIYDSEKFDIHDAFVFPSNSVGFSDSDFKLKLSQNKDHHENVFHVDVSSNMGCDVVNEELVLQIGVDE